MDKKNKNPNVPNLRFPLYKNKWECKKIKDIKNEKETDVLCVKCKNKSGAHCFW